MEMSYDGALVMPGSYAVMDEEEMTYVEGGAWNSVKNIGRALDVKIWIGGVVTGCIGIVGSVKEVLRRNARGLVVQSTNALLKKIGLSAIGFLASTIVSGLLLFLDLSMGEAIARVCDRIDKRPGDKLIAF